MHGRLWRRLPGQIVEMCVHLPPAAVGLWAPSSGSLWFRSRLSEGLPAVGPEPSETELKALCGCSLSGITEINFAKTLSRVSEIIKPVNWNGERLGAAVISTAASQPEGCGFNSDRGPFCAESECSPCSGFSLVLQLHVASGRHLLPPAGETVSSVSIGAGDAVRTLLETRLGEATV